MADSQALPDEDPGIGPEAEGAYDMEGTDSDAEAYPASLRCVLYAVVRLNQIPRRWAGCKYERGGPEIPGFQGPYHSPATESDAEAVQASMWCG